MKKIDEYIAPRKQEIYGPSSTDPIYRRTEYVEVRHLREIMKQFRSDIIDEIMNNPYTYYESESCMGWESYKGEPIQEAIQKLKDGL